MASKETEALIEWLREQIAAGEWAGKERDALIEWARRQIAAGKSFEGIEDPWLHHMDPAHLSDEYKAVRAEWAKELRQEAASALEEWEAFGNRDAMQAYKHINEMADKLETMTRPLPAPKPTLKRHPVSGEWIVADIDPVNPKTAAHEDMFSGLARTVRGLPKNLKNVIPLGVMAKILGGGAAKAAGVPGVTEVAELMGREEPTAQEFYRGQADAIADALGLPTGYAQPSPVHDPRREAAIRASLRSGREGLRPGPGETPVTWEEIEAYRRRQ